MTASWVLRNKATGEVIGETFDKRKVDALNTQKYEAVPIAEYLAGLNAEIAASSSDADKPTKPLMRR